MELLSVALRTLRDKDTAQVSFQAPERGADWSLQWSSKYGDKRNDILLFLVWGSQSQADDCECTRGMMTQEMSQTLT